MYMKVKPKYKGRPKIHIVSVRLSPDTFNKCKLLGIIKSAYMRDCLEAYIEDLEKKK